MCDPARENMPVSRILEIEALVHTLKGMSPKQRESVLNRECAGDAAKRTAIEAHLASHDKAETRSISPRSAEQPAVDWFDPARGLPDIPGYRVLRVIGRGGMGVVYEARQFHPDRPVALKIMAHATEAEIIAGLDHPNIVPVYEVGEWSPDDGTRRVAYYTMKLYPRGSLNSEPMGPGTDPIAHARTVVEIAKAVQHAHGRGLLHRDLKPANILLDDAGRPHVADFGLALQVDANGLTHAECIAGSLEYMAPEQAGGASNLTTAVDVYGLGAILYSLLTGRPPFQAATTLELLRLVRDPNLKPVPPRDLNPSVDPDLQAICLKCLAKNPADRYSSATSLADDIELWLAARQPSVGRWNLPYRTWRLLKRNPLVSILASVFLVALGLSDIMLAEMRLEERETQVLRSNAYTAQSVAKTVEERLQRWSSAVIRESQDKALRSHLEKRDQAELQKLMARAHAYYADPASGFSREGSASPFASWFITDHVGMVVAHADKDIAVGGSFPWRDYFQGVSKNRDGSAYVSRVYHSYLAGEFYKFAIAVPIRKGDARLGVVVATVLTDSTEETLLPRDAPQKAILVGRWDGNPSDQPNAAIRTDKHAPGQRLILLHSTFQRGHTAAEIHNERLFDEQNFVRLGYCLDDRYEDPVTRAKSNSTVRWLAASAPVRGTEFVVIVQQDYQEAVRPLSIVGRPRILWSAVGLTFLICVSAMVWSARKRLAR